MKAICIHQYGDASVFTECAMDAPSIGNNEILLKPLATSLNAIDVKIRSGAVPVFCPPFPAILHSDVCAKVLAVGAEVTAYQVGDHVWGCVGGIGNYQGVLREQLVSTAEYIAKKPDSLSINQAAAMPLVSITAWIGLFEKLRITKEDNVLIVGGAGGVGHIAAQMAKAVGATVCATVSNAAQERYLRDLGVDDCINYREVDLIEESKKLCNGKGFTAIFDTVGGSNLLTSFECASMHGRIATTQMRGAELSLDVPHQKGLSLSGVLMLDRLSAPSKAQAYHYYLNKVASMVDEHNIRPLLADTIFDWSDISLAHDYYESGTSSGKIIITIGANKL